MKVKTLLVLALRNRIFSLKRHFLPVIISTGILLSLSFVFTNKVAIGDIIQSTPPPPPTSWQGTFVQSGSPTVFGTDVAVAENQNVALSTNPSGGYQVGLISSATSGSMRSVTIAPDTATFNAWTQFKVTITQPPGVAVANSSAVYDILCGDQISNCGATTFNNPLPGFQNLDPAAGSLNNPALPYSKIRIRISWTRTNTTYASVLLTDWQASWSLQNGISVTVSKTPTTANPMYAGNGGTPPGVGTNHDVSYTLSYSINKSVNNFYMELPFPTGIYSGTNYTVTFLNATDGGSANYSGNGKVTWNLGSKTAGTAGSVTATFRINIGPPDGTLFKTTAMYQANDASGGALIGPLYTGEDTLTISAKAYLLSRLMSPGVINANTNVTYAMFTYGDYYQSDIYNLQFTFTIPTCTTAMTPTWTAPSGVTAVVNGIFSVTFNAGNYKWSSGVNKLYTVTVKANPSCSSPLTAMWQVTATDQLSTFVQDITKTRTSFFTTSTLPVLSVDKSTWTSQTGPSQRIDYNIGFIMDYSAPVTGFYAIETIPTQSVFLSAVFNTPLLMANGINPNAANPILTYTSSNASQPGKADSSWKILNADGTSFYGTATTFVKWESGGSGNLYWDKVQNEGWPSATLSVVTTSSATSGTVNNTVRVYGTNTCVASCTDTNSITTSNVPAFVPESYAASPNPANAGSNTTFRGDIYTASTGNAKGVVVTMKIPDQQFLDQTTPIISAKAYCYPLSPPDHCPEEDGTLQSPNPSVWLDAAMNYACTSGYSGANYYCRGYNKAAGTVTWTLPLMYTNSIYPSQYPNDYYFEVVVKTRMGLADNTTANCLNPPLPPTVVNCTLSATGWNSTKTTFDYSKSANLVNGDLVIHSSPILSLSKTVNPTVIDYGKPATYTLTYNNTGSGSATTYIIDNIPQVDTNPPRVLLYQGATSPNETFCWGTTAARNGPKPAYNDPGWACGAPSSAPNTTTWVKWTRSNFGIDTPSNVTLAVADNGSPNNTTYQNKASVSFVDSGGNEVVATSPSADLTISNPGFITSSGGGDIGSVNGIDFRRTLPNGANSTQYLGISSSITLRDLSNNCCVFSSAKNWLVGSGYTLNPAAISYDSLWPGYSATAGDCVDVNTCLANPSSPNGAVRKYSGSCPFDITSVTTNTYPNGNGPLILFIPCVNGTNGDLKIDTNFTVGSTTGVVFVVKGDIMVDKGVTTIEGVFLSDGQFSSGSLGAIAGNGDAGRNAAIAIGRDGYPRIVYMVDNDIRFIRCQYFDCVQKTFSYVNNITSVTSIQFDLDKSGATDIPKIVVSQRDPNTGAVKVYYINCKDQDCLTKDDPVSLGSIVSPDGAVDADVAMNGAQPQFSEAAGSVFPRVGTWGSCTDSTCSSMTTNGVLGGVSNDQAYSQIEMDGSTPVLTFVKAGTGQIYMARQTGSATLDGCNIVGWSCRKFVDLGANMIGQYPSMALSSSSSGNIRMAWANVSTGTLQYYGCNAQICDTTTNNNGGTVTLNTTGCSGGTGACQVLDYATIMVPSGYIHPMIVYNAKSSTNNYDIRFAFCVTTCSGGNWIYQTIVSGVAGTDGAHTQVFSQGMAAGPEAPPSTLVAFPRIVYYDAQNRDLVYVRCITSVCDTKSSFVLDSGDPITLADVSLIINGSLFSCLAQAGCKINLQRDLFNASISAAGETFILQPRYFYIFKDILAKKSLYQESSP